MLPQLKHIPLVTDFKMRAPFENMERVVAQYEHQFEFLNSNSYVKLQDAFAESSERSYQTNNVVNHFLYTVRKQVVALYGLGHPVATAKDRLQEMCAARTAIEALSPPTEPPQAGQTYRDPFLTIALLTLPHEELEALLWQPLFDNTKPKERIYVIDVLQSAFHQDYKMARKYTRDKFAHIWADPLHKALNVDPDNKEAGLAHLMDGWTERMARFVPLDWKPWEEEPYKYIADDGRKIFALPNFGFAYEVALAVCAYDLDDTGLRDHPYYPGDLVDYYRENLRDTRDAWRKQGAGPTMALDPYSVVRIDLSKKKAKGFRRWLDIASDGDPDAVGEVIGVCKNLRKVKSITRVVNVMGDYGIALTADLKDDRTFEGELIRIAKARKIETAYVVPATKYDAGSGRCSELLEHARDWFAEHGHRLIELSQDGDWGIIVIDQTWEDEFRDLSRGLDVQY